MWQLMHSVALGQGPILPQIWPDGHALNLLNNWSLHLPVLERLRLNDFRFLSLGREAAGDEGDLQYLN